MSAMRWAAAVVVLASSSWAAAQGPPEALTGQQRTLLEQVALGKARGALLEQVCGLPISGASSVGRWAAGSVELDRAVRLWVRAQPRHGVARHYSDGVCEVDVRLDPESLRDQVLAWLADESLAPRDGDIGPDAVRSAVRRWPTLWATGTARLGAKTVAGKPPGWEEITNEGLELARAAAVADANRALVEEAARLRVSHARRLREFLDSGEAIRDALREALLAAATVTVSFEPDQVAVATMQLELRRLPKLLADIHAAHYTGDVFAAADFREMLLLAGRDMLESTGLAAPPQRCVIREPYPEIELDVPEWAARSLTATGRFTPDEGTPADAEALAESARLAGIDRLRREIEKLVIQKNVTVAQFVSYHQELKSDVVLALSAARPVAPPRKTADGAVEVTVELPLRRLWEIVRRAMDRVEVEPAEAAQARATTVPAAGERAVEERP
ncbi:MAG: hypothetical protein IPM13_08310 [Phycisphaerales bacterium]|nr:hypothetical protein [Phycisphaerales bacterium]